MRKMPKKGNGYPLMNVNMLMSQRQTNLGLTHYSYCLCSTSPSIPQLLSTYAAFCLRDWLSCIHLLHYTINGDFFASHLLKMTGSICFPLFSHGHATLHLAVLVGQSNCPSHFWIPGSFCITAPAQLSTTRLPCIRPCFFLVADTRLYTLPCRSLCPSVTFLNSEPFSHYCSCPTVHDWIALYPSLFNFPL